MNISEPDVHAIFTVKPIKHSSSATIKCAGHVTEEERQKKGVGDEPIVCNNIKDTSIKDPNIKDEEKYIFRITDTVFARFYKCYIVDSYIMTHKVLPVLYASIIYKTQIVGGHLLNIFIEFSIEDENIKSEKQLIGNTIKGKYLLTIKKDNDENPKTMELDSYTTEAMTIETLKTIIDTKEMRDVIEELLEQKRQERVEKYGSFTCEEFEISRPKYNFNKLVQEYINKNKI